VVSADRVARGAVGLERLWAHAFPLSGADGNADCAADRHGHADRSSDVHRTAHLPSYRDGYARSACGDVHGDAEPRAYCHSNADAYAIPTTYGHPHAKPGAYRHSYGGADAGGAAHGDSRAGNYWLAG